MLNELIDALLDPYIPIISGYLRLYSWFLSVIIYLCSIIYQSYLLFMLRRINILEFRYI